jgi:hypothetical protein
MSEVTRICEACGSNALIHDIHYVYDNLMYRGGGGKFEQVLRETRYDIECPKCGRRTVVVKAEKE